jgi:hypothetical protein
MCRQEVGWIYTSVLNGVAVLGAIVLSVELSDINGVNGTENDCVVIYRVRDGTSVNNCKLFAILDRCNEP